MYALLLFILFGIAFGCFATLNTTPISISFGYSLMSGVPLYLVIFGSIILGVLFTTIFYLVESFGRKKKVAQQAKEIAQIKKENIDLVKKNHELEIENTRLQATYGEISAEDEVI